MFNEDEFWIAIWILAALLIAALGHIKGRRPFLVFLYGLLLPPVALVHMLFASPDMRIAMEDGARLKARFAALEKKIEAARGEQLKHRSAHSESGRSMRRAGLPDT